MPSTLALALTGGSVTGGSVVVERDDVMGVAIVNSVSPTSSPSPFSLPLSLTHPMAQATSGGWGSCSISLNSLVHLCLFVVSMVMDV